MKLKFSLLALLWCVLSAAAHATVQYEAYENINAVPLPPVTQFASANQQQELALTQFIQNYNKRLSWEAANMMAETILQTSQGMGVDFRLMTGLLAVESSFRSDAISSSGAIGLGQLKPDTARWLGVANPFDPIQNIFGATRYIRYLLNRYNGDMDSAVSAYFQGQGNVDRKGITQECREYLNRINQVLSKLAVANVF